MKDAGVECFFEKEQIWTFDGKGELLITIMSSLAQEESRSISENVTWGQRKRMQDGKVTLPYKHFLGYKKGESGLPEIVEDEAVVVRQIYQLYLQGRTINAIAQHLTAEGIPTPSGKKVWSVSTIKSILQNEKYKGDALLQKGYTVDFLTKERRINNGEIPQYYVENSHPAIVSAETYGLVQAEMRKRKTAGRAQRGMNPFSTKIKCGQCGQFFGPKTWHSNSKYRRTIWRCNHKYSNGEHCQTPHLYETAIQKAFVNAFNQLIGDRGRLKEDYGIILSVLTDTAALESEAAAQQTECDIAMELIRKLVEDNTRAVSNQDDCQRRYDALSARYEAAKKRLGEIAAEKQARIAKRDGISRFIEDMDKCGLLSEFDERLWLETVDSVTVHSEKDVAVSFRDGSEVHVDISGK